MCDRAVFCTWLSLQQAVEKKIVQMNCDAVENLFINRRFEEALRGAKQILQYDSHDIQSKKVRLLLYSGCFVCTSFALKNSIRTRMDRGHRKRL